MAQIKIEESLEEDSTHYMIERGDGDSAIIGWIEEDPEFPGGETAMLKFINDSLVYPPAAVQQGLEGLVYVRFNIDKKGIISDFKILKGISKALDEEALRVVSSFPKKWKPYYFAGEYLATEYIVPINFVLPEK
ncbi:MAG: protein TonB [Arenicella sp.]|jgi:protein TonB